MSHETFDLIAQLRRAGKRATMATLVRTVGTTPRKEGTKMFVSSDGGIFGSVTIGGCVDARVIEQAAEVLSSSAPHLINVQLGDEEAWEIGLTCSGGVDVYIEPLHEDVMRLYEAARDEWQQGRAVAIATAISGEGAGARVLLREDGTTLESGGRAVALDKLDKRAAAWPARSQSTEDVYIEVLRPPATLIIFGAGAVAIPVVTLAKTLGFRTVVIDGRARFANRERFPEADDIRVGIVSEIAGQMEFNASTPLVLVAHDYKIEVPVLEKALLSETPYIGLLGSRRRGAAILQMLRESGVPQQHLSRIRNPIGLDLGGETVADIALSIVSEVVAVMNGKSGVPLSTKSRERAVESA